MDCGGLLSGFVLTRVSVVWNGRGDCELCGITSENHATLLARVPIIFNRGSCGALVSQMTADADVGRYQPMAEPQGKSKNAKGKIEPGTGGWRLAGKASILPVVQTLSFTPCDILL